MCWACMNAKQPKNMGLWHSTASMQQPKNMGVQYGTAHNTGMIAIQPVRLWSKQKTACDRTYALAVQTIMQSMSLEVKLAWKGIRSWHHLIPEMCQDDTESIFIDYQIMGGNQESIKWLLFDSLTERVPLNWPSGKKLHKSWICSRLPHKFVFFHKKTRDCSNFSWILQWKQRKDQRKYKNYTHLYLQAHSLHKNEVKKGKRSKREKGQNGWE